MSDKITKFSENAVNIIYVIGGIWTFLSVIVGILLKYGHNLLNGITKEVSHAKEINEKELKIVNDKIKGQDDKLKEAKKDQDDKLKEVKKDQAHLRELHDDHYGFQKKIEPEFSELKNEVKNIVKDFDRLQILHDKNHGSPK